LIHIDYVVFVWGSGPHRVDYGNVAPKEVIVSRKCAEAVLRGAQVYVPGILACSAHVEKGDTVAVSVAIEQQGSDGGWSSGMTRGIVLQGSETVSFVSQIHFIMNEMGYISAKELQCCQGLECSVLLKDLVWI
jgi:hypothetical protein